MNDKIFNEVSNGIVDVPGFKVAGVACDIRKKKKDRLDLGIIFSKIPCQAAGTFTENKVKAAPVELCMQTLNAGNSFHAIVVNSGNANAVTGLQGVIDAKLMQSLTAELCSVDPGSVFVCSTGKIGITLPMENIKNGISAAVEALSSENQQGENITKAILTTDTRTKKATIKINLEEGKVITIGAIAKGAGMIQPNMATMLSFIATDAQIEGSLFQEILKSAVDSSFNSITVDGDMSTNDTVLALANGNSGIEVNRANEVIAKNFSQALVQLCQDLAYQIVSDGEKISKVVEVVVVNALSKVDAEKVARTVGNSSLVKSSWYGADPNWGRLMGALGCSGAEIKPEKLNIQYAESVKPFSENFSNTVDIIKNGEPCYTNETEWDKLVALERFIVFIDLNLGKEKFHLISTDLTPEYVSYNKSEK